VAIQGKVEPATLVTAALMRSSVVRTSSINSENVRSSATAFLLYLGLLLIALGLGVLGLLSAPLPSPLPALWMVPPPMAQFAVALISLVLFVCYVLVMSPYRWPPWSTTGAILLGVGTTIGGLAFGFLVASAPLALLLAVGAAFATYMGSYWRWSAEQTGLLVDKQERVWPPGEAPRAKTLFRWQPVPESAADQRPKKPKSVQHLRSGRLR
jgi:hypothetical protein